MLNHTVVWFEIPVTNINRATSFYSTVLDCKMDLAEMGPMKMSIFPGGGMESVHGALVQGESYTPTTSGTVVYLNGGDDLAIPLARVTKAGGKILQEKMAIGQHGFCAFFLDTEGNRVGLHSMK